MGNQAVWGDKHYNSLNYYLRSKFQEKVYKISVDAGFTCPNRDGSVGYGGCIFCSEKGSGDFAGMRNESIFSQVSRGAEYLKNKYKINKYIVYFQAFTNTYAPVDELSEKYFEALSYPGVIGIAIATRPDCISDEVIDLLIEIKKTHMLWVELGLQTIHQDIAKLINRGYDLNCFDDTVARLKQAEIDTVCHLILGLPYESHEMMKSSVRYVAQKRLWGIKLQLLHVIEGTKLADMYRKGLFTLMERDEYIKLVADCIEILPPDMVIHRLTGDGPRDLLLGPKWSEDKINILKDIENELKVRNSWQGKYFEPLA